MKNKTLLLGLVLLIPSALGFVTVTKGEDYSDDTVGANPSGTYTYVEESGAGGSVISGGQTGNGYRVDANSWAAFNDFENFDFCTGTDQVEYWFNPTYGGSTSQGAHVQFGLVNANSGDGDTQDFRGSNAAIIDVTPTSSSNFFLAAGWQQGATFQTDVIISGGMAQPFGSWYKVIITSISCFAGDPSMTVSVYDSAEVLIASGLAKCELCSALAAGTYDVIGYGDINSASSGNVRLSLDGWDFGDIVVPEAPTGVRATVTNNEVNPDEYLVKFTLSPDDTNQNTADYSYRLYYDLGSGTVLYDTYPAGTAISGVIGDEVLISTTGSITFWATATDPVTGFEGVISCTVTVDSTILDDTDTCGTVIPGEESSGSDLAGPQGGLFGGDKAGLADSLQISEPGLEMLVGTMFVLLLIAGGWFTYGMVGAGGLGLIGLIVAYALGLFPFWTLYVIGFIIAALAILLIKIRGVASG